MQTDGPTGKNFVAVRLRFSVAVHLA
jgi:hypothetical protein